MVSSAEEPVSKKMAIKVASSVWKALYRSSGRIFAGTLRSMTLSYQMTSAT